MDWLAWVSLLFVVEGDVLVILAFCVLSVFKERLNSNKLSTNSFENFGVLVGDAMIMAWSSKSNGSNTNFNFIFIEVSKDHSFHF